MKNITEKYVVFNNIEQENQVMLPAKISESTALNSPADSSTREVVEGN